MVELSDASRMKNETVTQFLKCFSENNYCKGAKEAFVWGEPSNHRLNQAIKVKVAIGRTHYPGVLPMLK